MHSSPFQSGKQYRFQHCRRSPFNVGIPAVFPVRFADLGANSFRDTLIDNRHLLIGYRIRVEQEPKIIGKEKGSGIALAEAREKGKIKALSRRKESAMAHELICITFSFPILGNSTVSSVAVDPQPIWGYRLFTISVKTGSG